MICWTVTIAVLTAVNEVYADYCGDNIFCDSPYKCCEIRKGCCYDNMLHSSRHFRLQIWNMWYFWFLIIFMMMSCFGGCGYYRRRRLAMLTRPIHAPTLRPTTILEAPIRRSMRTNDGNARQYNFFAYIGPGVNLPQPVSNLPPTYTEVVNQPVNYGGNKMELPPYPGNDKPEDEHFGFAQPPPSSMLPPSDVCLPPPYSEYTYGPGHQVPTGVVSSQNLPFHGYQDQQSSTERANNITTNNVISNNH